MPHRFNRVANSMWADDHRAVRFWLYGIAVLVSVMVLVGGATRLTDSGLSITEWAPIAGMIPPLNAADWATEFTKYKTTTEYQTVNAGMSLDQFKFIFWWEWGHRFLGRLIGFAVILPMIWFWTRGQLPAWLKPLLIGLVILGGMQGAIGWWMVKSGLTERVDVSQLRLAIHLTLACVILVATIWLARSLAQHSESPAQAIAWQGGALIVLLLVQIFIGGIVAGLDAGMAYNTWPKMDGVYVPTGILVMEPWWQNFLDNAKAAQFLHRVSAYILWGAAGLHAVLVVAKHPTTTHSRRAVFLFVLITLQACIGIMTLLLQVPISWALMHQFGGVVLLVFATAHWRALSPRNIISSTPRSGVVSPSYGAA